MPDESPIPEYVHRANMEKLMAERRHFDALAAKEDEAARQAQIKTNQMARDEARRLTDNDLHGILYFDGPVTESTASAAIAFLDGQHRRFPGKDLEIVFTSPGGSVVDGMRLFDHIGLIRRQGHKVTTGTLGMAASMGGILLQAGDHRWMGAEAFVLIHQISAGVHGSYGEIEDRVKWFDRVQSRILDIFAARAKQAGENGTASKPATRALLEKNWRRTDWWLDSDEALKLGIVDEIR